MIDIIFTYLSDTILVRIKGNEITFGNTAYGSKLADIGGLRLSQSGVLKEFPELKDEPDWRTLAFLKFKEKFSLLGSEDKKAEYLIDDLTKFGYVPMYLQKSGNRPIKLS